MVAQESARSWDRTSFWNSTCVLASLPATVSHLLTTITHARPLRRNQLRQPEVLRRDCAGTCHRKAWVPIILSSPNSFGIDYHTLKSC